MRDALIEVKRELGRDAVILQTRRVTKRGLLDVFGREQIEITAATKDYDLSANQQEQQTRAPTEFRPTAPQIGGTVPPPKRRPEPIIEEHLSPEIPRRRERALDSSTVRSGDSSERVMGELASVKTALSHLADKLRLHESASLPEALASVCDDLIDRGVDERLVQKFASVCVTEMSAAELSRASSLEGKITAMISNCIREAPAAKTPVHRPHVVAVVGPTGTGKTTTLAKMATNEKIWGQRKVAFISADTYRIAAVEQLKTFAAIASIPVRVVYSPDEMPEALGNLRNLDYVLIDTAGRSPNHMDHLLELRQFMQRAAPDEIHLVLSVTTKPKDLLDIIGKFNTVGVDRLTFTKLDESSTPGTIVNIAAETSTPVAFVTFGQRVPGDIAAVNAGHLAEIIMFGGRP